MALLTLTEAAAAVGKDRSTIHRNIEKGRLSAVLDASGERRVDTSELIRVFGQLVAVVDARNVAPDVAMQQPAQAENGELVQVLREQLRLAAERETRLMDLVDRLQAQLALPEGRGDAPAETKKGFWARLFG